MSYRSLPAVPSPGDVLWKGLVDGKIWTVACESVRAVGADSDLDEHGLATSGDAYWVLSFVADGEEILERLWFPESRILHGTLQGWTKATIGDLKRALIQFKRVQRRE